MSMGVNLKVFHRGLILAGVPLAVAVLIVSLLFLVVLQSDREVERGQRYKRIEELCVALVIANYRCGYELNQVIREGAFPEIARVAEQLKQVVLLRRELNSLFDQQEKEKFRHANERMNNNLSIIAGVLRPLLTRGFTLQSVLELQEYKKQLGEALAGGYEGLEKLLSVTQNELVEANMRKQSELRRLQAGILLAGLAASVLIAVWLARFFVRGIVSRLNVVMDNTRALKEGLPLNARLAGTDEIAEVDRAFHEMACALARTRERERALFDNASDVICVLDRQGRFTRVNPASVRVWGREPESLVGRSIFDVLAAADRERVGAAMRRAQSENPAGLFEGRIVCRDGSLMDTLWSVYWAESESSLFCVAHDISERKKLETMKQEFLAMVSHDLRTPLSSIAGIFEMLSRGTYGQIPAAAVDKVAMAARNVKRLLSMVNDLLDMEKLDAGQLELTVTSVSMADLLQRCREEVESVAEQRRVTIVVEDCQVEFPADAERMIQVVVNLLSNAIKFSPEGGVVTLSGQAAADGVLIQVKDQGRGVPAAHREAIFERFKQVEAADGKRKAGTGLGLPICKQMVELHGGRIGVDSEEGKGSTFWIRLPLAPQAVTDAQAQGAGAGSAATAAVAAGAPPPAPPRQTAPRARGFSPGNDLSMVHKGFLLVGVPVVFEFVLVGLLTGVLIQVDRVKAHESYLHTITFNATRLVADMMDIGRTVSGDETPEAWQAFERSSQDCLRARAELRRLTMREPALSRTFQEMDRLSLPAYQFLEQARQYMAGGFSSEALEKAWENRLALGPVVSRMTDKLLALVVEVDRMPSVSAEHQRRLREQQGRLLAAGIAVPALLSLMLVAFFSQGITSRLAVLRENELRLARDQELKPPLAGRDEIAHLDAVFHAMATSLAEARQKERAVFDNSKDVICAVDRQGLFQQINSACLHMWGYEPEELLRASMLDLLEPDDRQLAAGQFAGPGPDGSVRRFENRIVCKNGCLQDVLWSANWSESSQLFFCVAHDISRRKELERLKQDFLAMVSHDLRTPLTAVVGIAKLMTAGAFGPLPDPARQKLKVVINNVDRMLTLINDLLDIEKLDAGQMQLALEPVELAAVLERSRQSVEPMARERGIEIAIGPCEGVVEADPDRLVQVVVNLLANAVKFSPDGSRVAVTSQVAGGTCEVRVSDQGRGVPESHRQLIFERFKQVQAADGRRGKGTGLGLPICKKIVEQHGGTIGVDCPDGGGSTFWFRIPAKTPGVSPAAVRS